jgi:hypothetical protein
MVTDVFDGMLCGYLKKTNENIKPSQLREREREREREPEKRKKP